jgi:lipoprotein-releasing system ATP-binding protein
VNETEPVVVLRGVCKRFGGGDTPIVEVLRGVNLELCYAESVAVVGPSGCGKSTLLAIVGAMMTPDSGDAIIDGRNLRSLDERSLARLRNQRIGFVFQSHHLLPQCTALENALVPTLAWPSGTGRDAVTRAKALFERVGLANRMNHVPAQMSGGERQRTAVVRALINQPGLLLADEPTGSLDAESAESLGLLLREVQREEQVAMLVVTHSTSLAARMDRVVTLRRGLLTNVNGGVVEAAS